MEKSEEMDRGSGDHIQATIGNDSSNIAVGKNIQQTIRVSSQSQVTEADLGEVRRLFEELKQTVETEAPPDKNEAAVEHVSELEETITGGKPDLDTISYVKKWFGKNVPQLAGAAVSVLVNPIVGKVV